MSIGLRNITIIFFLLTSCKVLAQDSLRFTENIAVAGRPYPDSIQLRWAPLTASIWQSANKNGYRIERYVVARNGKILPQPEKSTLTSDPLKPLPEDAWRNPDKYHAIAAQALFGDRFEVDLSKTDMFTIVNKVRENEQRFALALFSADMSPAVAKASALWFTDKNVVKGEKYLYRIIVNTPENVRGSIFIACDDGYDLPKPLNVRAEFRGSLVSLKWDKNTNGKYTAYLVERSIDGKTFQSISDAPLVTVSPTDESDSRYEYAADSLTDLSKTYYYRVKGLTPFGEVGPASEMSSGKGAVEVADVPYINNGENVDNKSIRITWDFPEKHNSSIKGFTVERSSKPGAGYVPLTLQSPLPSTTRMYEDKKPKTVNYYRVTAIALNGEKFSSPVYLAQLVDSIPPAVPAGLKAKIDAFSGVELSWEPNKDEDIYGYRVYRSNVETEEFSQVTSEPVPNAFYKDQVNVNTLSKAVYYRVMAIDRNQNHSGLSTLLKVDLPDKIKPQPPVMLPAKSDENAVRLSWMRSSSDDVANYEVYRKAYNKNEWQRLKIIKATADSVMEYKDETALAGKTNDYTVTAVDESGLESDPAIPISAGKIDSKIKPQVEWKPVQIVKEQNRIILRWDYKHDVLLFRIYRAVDENPLVMFKSVAGDKREFTDILQSGKKYTYRILAVFNNGAKSALSSELVTHY